MIYLKIRQNVDTQLVAHGAGPENILEMFAECDVERNFDCFIVPLSLSKIKSKF